MYAGVFSVAFYDFAAPIGEPLEKQWIQRHRLTKIDTRAESSEAIEPIVYYLDRGTPEPIRTALLEGARDAAERGTCLAHGPDAWHKRKTERKARTLADRVERIRSAGL